MRSFSSLLLALVFVTASYAQQTNQGLASPPKTLPKALSGVQDTEIIDPELKPLAMREALTRKPDNGVNHFNLGIVCVLRKNRDCALTQYNYLKLKSDPLAKTLFSNMYGNKVVDATAYRTRSH